MDIQALSMAMAQQNVLQSVGTSVLKNSIEQAQVAGDQIAAMMNSSAMELSVNPNIGANFDVSV